MALVQPPAATGAHPGMWHPVVARATRGPMAADPDMASADPVPITANPDKSRLRRHADDLDLRRRRCDRDEPDAHDGCRHGDRAANDTAAEQAGAGDDCQDHGANELHMLHEIFLSFRDLPDE